MTDDELRSAMKEHAYLEGEFVLRSGKTSRYYLDKYRFETRPDLLRAIGERLAAQIAEHEPDATLIAGRSSARSRSRRRGRSSPASPS